MKSFFSISGNVESSPLHLGTSLLVATASMLYINATVGAMGGIPLWVGMMVVFYVIRGIVIAGNRMTHHLAFCSKQEVRRMMAAYGIAFFAIWAVMKILLTLAQMLGWGSVSGMTAKECFDSIYGSTLVERWAYVFAAILVISFVMSLFPLVVIRKKELWTTYLIIDGIAFWGISRLVIRICDIWIQKPDRQKIHNVMDALFMCVTPHKWQAGLFLGGAVILLLMITGMVYVIANHCYGPKPGNIIRIPEYFQTENPKEREKIQKEKRKTLILVIVAAVVLVLAVAVFVLFLIAGRMQEEPSYHKVAECLTEDRSFGPVVYNDQVYIPVHRSLDYHENEEPKGYFAYKGENVDSRFYQLSIANMLYTGENGELPDYLEMYGADMNSYERADKVEKDTEWKNDSIFVLWDEEWLDETAYSRDRTGYSICEKGIVEMLENEFGEVTYRPEDFDDYDAYFTISGYQDPKEAFGDEVNCGEWIGCILVKDNHFYYGNYDNAITGVTLQELLKVLGGNEMQQETQS
ncbi:hypothetical protein ACQRCQ_08245 [Lachnospiraceae bacterium SGI.085]